jgi:hypothetical protein
MFISLTGACWRPVRHNRWRTITCTQLQKKTQQSTQKAMKTTKIPRKIFIDSTYTLRQEIWEGTGQMFPVIRNKPVRNAQQNLRTEKRLTGKVCTTFWLKLIVKPDSWSVLWFTKIWWCFDMRGKFTRKIQGGNWSAGFTTKIYFLW